MKLPAARHPADPQLRLGAGQLLSDGTLYGTFCAAGLTSDKDLTKRDKALMEVLASAASVIIEPQVREQRAAHEIEDRLAPVMAAGGPLVVLQPIVDLATGARVGAEALSRFPAEWGKAPDVVLRARRTASVSATSSSCSPCERAADHLDRVAGYVADERLPRARCSRPSAPSCSTGCPLDRGAARALRARPGRRLRRPRRRPRPAPRRAGCGWPSTTSAPASPRCGTSSSPRPDVIKLDRSIVNGVDADPVLTTLVRSLVDFAHGCGARVVAEGVETAEDAAVLRDARRRLRPGLALRPARPCPSRSRTPEPAPVVAIPVPRPYRPCAPHLSPRSTGVCALRVLQDPEARGTPAKAGPISGPATAAARARPRPSPRGSGRRRRAWRTPAAGASSPSPRR